nr:MAG: ORF1 [TTV-like mini virus]
MPWNWYRRRRRWTWRRRRRPYWRGIRKTFRRRPRRRNWVRKKLKKLSIKQYQPPSIRKCRIRGMICLLQCSYARLTHNWTMYENTYAPPHLPNGGGFSIMKFSLQNLYDMHTYARNYWSQSNIHLPLVRYCGCKIRLYQSKTLDYLVKTQTSYPMTSGELTYPSTQPSVMLQTKKTHIIPSKNTEKRKRPYKTIRLPPPSQLENKWYFQKEFSNLPLLLLYTSATNLEYFYTDPGKISTTLTINCLNTFYFQNRQWAKNPDTGYSAKSEGTQTIYFYASRTTNIENPKIQDIIPLTNTTKYTEGKDFTDVYHGDQTKWNEWKTNIHKQHWGNPFYPSYLNNDGTFHLYQTDKNPTALFQSKNYNEDAGVTKLLDPFIIPIRYNINRDNGQDVRLFFKRNNRAETGWAPPDDDSLELTGLPVWLAIWGFVDWQKKLNKTIGLDTEHVLTIQTTHTQPIRTTIVPVDQAFIEGKSPYELEANPFDKDKWYPQLQYQEQIINTIASVGPGCPKLSTKSEEAHALYTFYFKFGGSPAPMSNIENPEHQIQYPLPSNKQQTSSLQNPAQPIEYYLQSFDQRRDTITATAAKRISTDWETKTSFIDYAGLSMDPDKYQTLETLQIQPPQTTEESEEEILQQLLQQRQQQQLIKQRIIQLMDKYQNLE